VPFPFAISWGIPGAVLPGSRLTEAVPFSLATYSPLYYVGEGVPLLSTLLISGWGHGQRGLADLADACLDWRFLAHWWAFAHTRHPGSLPTRRFRPWLCRQ
jgi:hypothetical protein